MNADFIYSLLMSTKNTVNGQTNEQHMNKYVPYSLFYSYLSFVAEVLSSNEQYSTN